MQIKLSTLKKMITEAVSEYELDTTKRPIVKMDDIDTDDAPDRLTDEELAELDDDTAELTEAKTSKALYIEVAKILKACSDSQCKEQMIEKFSNLFSSDNPNFDKSRFVAACQ